MEREKQKWFNFYVFWNEGRGVKTLIFSEKLQELKKLKITYKYEKQDFVVNLTTNTSDLELDKVDF